MRASINSNRAFQRAIFQYDTVDRDTQFRRSRLASGLRVNGGSDDGAQLTVSEGMRAEIGGLTEGTKNAETAIDLLRTAEGAMGEMSTILIRMREIAVESTSDTLNDLNREALDTEFNQLKEYIDRIAKLASYNGHNLLAGFGTEVSADASTAIADVADTGVQRVTLSSADAGTYTFLDDPGDGSLTLGNGVTTQTVYLGTPLNRGEVADGTAVQVNFDQLGVEVYLAGEGVDGVDGKYADGDLAGKTLVVEEGTGGVFQLGSDADAADRIEYDIRDMTIGGPVLNLSSISIRTRDGARLSLAKVDEAIDRVASERGSAGAMINRLEYTLSFTASAIQEVTASESTVRGADYALESTALARNQILQQLSQASMLNSRVGTDMTMSLLA